MLFDGGVVAQEPDRRAFVGAQLGEHDEMAQAGLGGLVGEAPLLVLSLFGGGGDEIGPPGTGERRGDGFRIVEVGDDGPDAGGQRAAIGLFTDHGPHRCPAAGQGVHNGPPRVAGSAGHQDGAVLPYRAHRAGTSRTPFHRSFHGSASAALAASDMMVPPGARSGVM